MIISYKKYPCYEPVFVGGEMLWTVRNMIEVSSYHSLKYNNSGKGKPLRHCYRKQDQRESPFEFTFFLLIKNENKEFSIKSESI